jgi:hypothetical protein
MSRQRRADRAMHRLPGEARELVEQALVSDWQLRTDGHLLRLNHRGSGRVLTIRDNPDRAVVAFLRRQIEGVPGAGRRKWCGQVPDQTRAMIRQAQAQGWKLSVSSGNHLRLDPPGGGHPVFLSATPSDWRSCLKIRSALRKAGVVLP